MNPINPELQTLLDTIYARCRDDGGCQIWLGKFTASKYPRMRMPDGHDRTIRRVLAAHKIGRPLNEKEVASSTCNDPRCLCFEHIRVVTISKRRRETGAAGGYSTRLKATRISTHIRATVAKLIGGQAAADAIRLDPRPSHLVAPEYGLSSSMVRKIRCFKAWKPLNNPFAGLGAR